MIKLPAFIFLFLVGVSSHSAGSPDHGATHARSGINSQIGCTEAMILCAKTVTAAVAESGRIWFAWTVGQHLYINYSDDRGLSFSPPFKVNQVPEKIAARGENRPKIALDKAGNIYLSWVNNLPQKWKANIRFAWSDNQGESFSAPLTINDDSKIASHSFNEMLVSDDGQVHIGWLDGRRADLAREQNQAYKGSAIYFASFKTKSITQAISAPKNVHLTDGSCVCCRLGMALDLQERPLVMWRHIFGDNIRDHALLAMDSADRAGKLTRVSFENWKIEGCPHHGPSLLSQERGNNQRLHMSWFNDAPQASGLFYAFTDDQGENLSETLHLASSDTRPGHPFLGLTADKKLQLVWQEFNGEQHSIKLMRSDAGEHWSEPQEIAHASGVTDYPFILSHPKGNLLLWHRLGQPLQLIEID